MKGYFGQSLLAPVVLIAVLLGGRPAALAARADMPRGTVTGVATTHPTDLPTTPIAGGPASAVPVAPADSALGPCAVAAHRAACDDAVAELAAYGLDIADPSGWTAVGLRRFVEAVERLADAFGGGGGRAGRIAALTGALGIGPGPAQIVVVWQAEPQARNGSPVRGGYAADRLYFNPNTLYLDVDTPDEAAERAPAMIWWNIIHELAHLWDERSAPAAAGRHSARLQTWVRGRQAEGRDDAYPSSYAVIGGPAEAFAESVAATVTGDAADRDYYGSPRNTFVQALLCDAAGCAG